MFKQFEILDEQQIRVTYFILQKHIVLKLGKEIIILCMSE